ncbi:MAG: chemotaxis protein CheA, partial [Phycisphaerae bacterium]
MTNREEARNLITDLGEEVSAASRGNTDAVARLGFLIESAVETLEGDLPHVSDVLTECLCLLQKVYQESVDSSAAALVGEVLDELSEIVDADDADSQDLHSLIEKLQQADGQPPADAEGAEAAETIQTAETPSENSVSTTINSVSARLLTLTADDTESLVELRDELCKVAAVQTVPTAAGEVLQAAGEAMDRITSGEAGDADELLQQVGSLLEKAALVVEEESQQEELSEGPETSDGPTEPEEPAEEPAADEPAAEEPQQQTPDILPADADTDLLAEFVIESLDHISGAEAALLELESTPGDDEQINIVFRAFHTIKGTSGFLGLDKMQSLAHKAENLLDRARDGEITISGGYADLSLKSCDVLRVMLEALEGIMPGEPLVIPGEYDSLLDVLSDPEGSGVSEEDAAGDKRIGEILVEQGASDSETVEKIAAQQGGEKLGSAMVKNKAAKAESVARALRTQKQARGRASGGDTTVRVSTDRLDNLINVVGELVIAHSMVAQDPTMEEAGPRMNRNVSHAGKIIRELQDLSMALRMVPMKGTFQKMARLVRDLGRKTGKSVQFVTEGDDTEIDRNMVEVLNDPLVHMIRN